MTGYYVCIDVTCGDVEDIGILRRELNAVGIHLTVLEMDGPSGWPFVRLRANGRTTLETWLKANRYEDETVVSGRNVNAIPRRRKV